MITYYIYKDTSGLWQWRLRAANQKIIAISSDGYQNKEDCAASIDLIKSSNDAPVLEIKS